MKVGEHCRQGMGAVEIRAAVSANDLHAGLFAEAQQMPQQEQRRFGCPVQVVEHEDDRRARRGDFQQRDDRIEQCVALGVRVGMRRRGQIGQDIGQSGHQRQQGFCATQPSQPARRRGRDKRPQRFGERLVRRAEVLVATAVQHDGALLVGQSRPLACQTGLADARLAGDQQCAHATGKRGLPGGRQLLELAAAADEWSGTGECCGQASGRSIGASVATPSGRSSSVCSRSSNTCSGRARLRSWRIPRSASTTSSARESITSSAVAPEHRIWPPDASDRQPRGAVDRSTEVVAVAKFDLAGVQCHADSHRLTQSPWLVGDGFL